ncbi:hypothetical protein [Bombilactobacillus thymidiniphilus]|uniref:Uncharacterized protein n=1 Tax=Bombilactobacillus thymidiniphilus TaxID=2923363 RepID=A0ABY4PET4_9LACO|nr:hypothetical protein [Bombilactobacillus thymidiniphilus]UQS84031.1 hypothetical protein MOO47_02275 [Bombilactobacillus thymidiniphilus]
MQKFMILLLVLCLISVGAGILLESWWLGIVPLFVALWPAAYFGSSDY